jgi:hypothetical protein
MRIRLVLVVAIAFGFAGCEPVNVDAIGPGDTSCSEGRCAPTCTGNTCVCPPSMELCGDTCVKLEVNSEHCGACGVACGEGFCAGSVCLCEGELSVCDGACVDVRADPTNCGACGVVCAGGQRCSEALCVANATGP